MKPEVKSKANIHGQAVDWTNLVYNANDPLMLLLTLQEPQSFQLFLMVKSVPGVKPKSNAVSAVATSYGLTNDNKLHTQASLKDQSYIYKGEVADGTKPEEKEVPILMLAHVATGVYASLKEHKNEACITSKFNSGLLAFTSIEFCHCSLHLTVVAPPT
ncbi:hypothetical protein L208DRAFT_1381405 [Tricholoma matsutake]|nr:hypothetical protein L208DRAFT_1381405 [Tricholoma matsutake 945]